MSVLLVDPTEEDAVTATIPTTDVITSGQLRQLRHEDPALKILDVRTGPEFERTHIPGSFNVPLDTLGEHVDDLAALDHPVVLVCQSGGRATQAHGRLSDAGKLGLHILEGGIGAWEESGGDVVHGDNDKWALDRQVRLVAGSIALGGVLASMAVPKAKWLSAGVAGGLVFSAATNSCAMGEILGKLPYNRSECDIDGVLAELRSA